MPILAAFLGSLLGGLIDWLAQFVTKKIAVAAALGTFLVAGWLAMELALKAIFEAVSYSVPSWMAGPLGVAAYLLPSNAGACISACVSALFVRWVWDAQREWAKAVAVV